MSKHRQHRQAFSLIEAILATFLVGLFLGVLANLTSTLRTVTRLSDEKASWAELRTLLGGIRAELTEAVQVTQPSSSSKVAQISLLRLRAETLVPNTATTARFNLPVTTNVSYYWNPIDPTFLESVVYDVNSKSLRRKLGSGTALPIATIESLQACQPKTGLFVVSLEVKSRKGTERFKCEVNRR